MIQSCTTALLRETLACIWAVEKLKMYLWGKPFDLVTDHKPLTYMVDGSGRGNGKASARLVRLLSKLQEYNFTIKHIAGKDNIRADFLSRLSITQYEPKIEDDTACVVSAFDIMCSTEQPCNESEWLSLISEDAILKKVKDYTVSKWPPVRNLSAELKSFCQVKDEISIVNDLLYCNDMLIPPTKFRSKLIEIAHRSHPGSTMTKRMLPMYYWWASMDSQVDNFVDSCAICLKTAKYWVPRVNEM